jgi:sulfite oxidase
MLRNSLQTRRALLKQIAAASAISTLPVSTLFGKDAEPNTGAGDVDKNLTWLDSDAPNGEPDLIELIKSWQTPVKDFYVRSHAPAPKIDVDTFKLEVEGKVRKPLSLSLSELKAKFKYATAVATLTCAGNRRQELAAMKPISGVPWGSGAAGNAKWGGYVLSEILKAAEIEPGAKHVWFQGLDEIQRSSGVIPFGGSIPLERAMAKFDAVPGAIIADSMNDKQLPVDHGYPLRSLVPGFIGARSVKWLGKVIVSDAPSPNHYLQNAYKIVKEATGEAFAKADPIYEFVINSVIANPKRGAEVKAGKVTVAGYALPSGSAATTVKQVQLSSDGGKTWLDAKITSPQKQFCWVLWSATVPVWKSTSALLARAIDSAGTTQPERVAWNAKGYLMNEWYKTDVKVSE